MDSLIAMLRDDKCIYLYKRAGISVQKKKAYIFYTHLNLRLSLQDLVLLLSDLRMLENITSEDKYIGFTSFCFFGGGGGGAWGGVCLIFTFLFQWEPRKSIQPSEIFVVKSIALIGNSP